MKTTEITRRQFVKGTGALIVSFNLFPTAKDAFAQFVKLPSADIDPASPDDEQAR